MLLGAASQRIEHLAIELFGPPWLKEILAGWKRRERGSFPGVVESGVIIYVISKLPAAFDLTLVWLNNLESKSSSIAEILKVGNRKKEMTIDWIKIKFFQNKKLFVSVK